MERRRSAYWYFGLAILLIAAAFSLDYGQKIKKCRVEEKKRAPLQYRIGRVRRETVANVPVLLLQISVASDQFNRVDMIALGHRLNEDFCNEKQLAVAICDNYEAAKDSLLMHSLLVHEPNPGLRGGYDLNRVTGEEGISFSTERGKPLNEVTINFNFK